jgi:Xaa-Pro aminopeptidase
MLSVEGCRQRRQRFVQKLDPFPAAGYVVLADPMHLIYLANFYVDPISSGASFGGFLVLRKDGHATLLHDHRLPKSVQEAHADEHEALTWYDGQTPGRGPRKLFLREALCKRLGTPNPPVHDDPSSPDCARVATLLAGMRRQKDSDEIALLEQCMRATDAGHAWARANIRPGLTELDVYSGVNAACTQEVGHAVVVYGDFAVSPGPERRGGPPTRRVLRPGDLFILDYSVVIGGYRSDFTNTLVVGAEPNPGQQRLYDLCTAAMAAGEKELRAGVACQTVYDAVRGVFEQAGVAQDFPHHAGHGLGLAHPEAPFLVRHSDETLLENDVVTLEPGLYIPDVGGLRIEHNYLVTKDGYRRLSHHTIALR